MRIFLKLSGLSSGEGYSGCDAVTIFLMEFHVGFLVSKSKNLNPSYVSITFGHAARGKTLSPVMKKTALVSAVWVK